MPLRRSQVHALDVISYSGDATATSSVQLRLHVSSGTYVRSIAHALGGHCTTLRRTAVGPFDVDEAAPVDDARSCRSARRLGACRKLLSAVSRRASVLRCSPSRSSRERRAAAERARVAAARSRDRHVRRRPHRPPRGDPRRGRRRTSPDGRHVRSASADGARQPRRAVLRRSSGGWSCSRLVASRTCSSSSSRPRRRSSRRRSSPRDVPGAIGAEVVVAGRRLPLRRGAEGDCELLRSLGLDAREVPLVAGVSSTRIRAHRQAGEMEAAAKLLGRPPESRASSSAATGAAARSAFRPRTSRSSRPARSRRTASTRARRRPACGGLDRRQPALRRHRAAHRGVPLDWEGDLYGDRLVVELWRRLREERAFESEAELIAQIARDVEETRAATRP